MPFDSNKKKKKVSDMTPKERADYDRKVRKGKAQQALSSLKGKSDRQTAIKRTALKKAVRRNTTLLEAAKEKGGNRLNPTEYLIRTERGVRKMKTRDKNFYNPI
jgi:hypothetical protein